VADPTHQGRAPASLARAPRARRPFPKPSRVDGIPYVFPGQNGDGHLHNMKRAWDRIRVKPGIHDVRFHDLRRTIGSWLAGSGESQHLIGKVLNHRDVSTTAIFARLNLNLVRRALERNALKMLEAAAPQRALAIMTKAKKQLRSTRNSTSHELEPARSESGYDIAPVTADR
jgi:integrase